MTQHLENADGQGQILIGGRLSPVAYQVSVERVDARYQATVTMHAPRDWLLKQGFKSRATLVLASGEQTDVSHDEPVEVGDNVSVILSGAPQSFSDDAALLAQFPELKPGDA
ncbi:hypothetical protein [Rhizobium sp. CECT 9324]|jgi:hypothetical protein|uniref:hypothetical protein n=1 Tax=Rhizobium sp. CECT 9324 TaxID=2845820 RepID=UPI000DDEC826|nr:hypothetical protein [Rhizobium sp. CECT 9324]CAH0338449.1 hypothetical protein RHI9324_00071 [Rhizobium sp. CECT 9324]